MPGHWSEDNHWIEMRESEFSWKKLRDLLQKMPDEKLMDTVTVNDGGSETLGSELVEGKFGLYIKGF